MEATHPDLLELASSFYAAEVRDEALYRRLARAARIARHREEMERFAAMEADHAAFWASVLEHRGVALPQVRAHNARNAVLAAIGAMTNPEFVAFILETGEHRAWQAYRRALEHPDLRDDERETLRRIILDEIEHEEAFRARRTTSGTAASVREMVLGMNDGVVEILGAVAGLVALWPDRPLTVLGSGAVVAIAGALSMAVGALVSARSELQVAAARRREAELLAEADPERAKAKVAKHLVDAGVPDGAADKMADEMPRDPATIARLLVPAPTSGALMAALRTGGAYLLGSLFPLFPFGLGAVGLTALAWAVGAAGILLALSGTAVALLSGLNVWRKILEMELAGLGAAAIAYGAGSLLELLTGTTLVG